MQGLLQLAVDAAQVTPYTGVMVKLVLATGVICIDALDRHITASGHNRRLLARSAG